MIDSRIRDDVRFKVAFEIECFLGAVVDIAPVILGINTRGGPARIEIIDVIRDIQVGRTRLADAFEKSPVGFYVKSEVVRFAHLYLSESDAAIVNRSRGVRQKENGISPHIDGGIAGGEISLRGVRLFVGLHLLDVGARRGDGKTWRSKRTGAELHVIGQKLVVRQLPHGLGPDGDRNRRFRIIRVQNNIGENGPIRGQLVKSAIGQQPLLGPFAGDRRIRNPRIPFEIDRFDIVLNGMHLLCLPELPERMQLGEDDGALRLEFQRFIFGAAIDNQHAAGQNGRDFILRRLHGLDVLKLERMTGRMIFSVS